jgi:hypothetical protein
MKSWIPCNIIVGHYTFFEHSKLLNLSSIIISTILPYFYRATSLTDLIGLINRRHIALLNLLARKQAGPEPIDLPLIIIFFSLNPHTSFKNS